MAVLEKAPPIAREHRFFWNAYLELGTERPSSGGMGGMNPIPLSAIRAYAQDYNLDEHEYHEFKEIIRAADCRACVLIAEKAAKASKK